MVWWLVVVDWCWVLEVNLVLPILADSIPMVYPSLAHGQAEQKCAFCLEPLDIVPCLTTDIFIKASVSAL